MIFQQFFGHFPCLLVADFEEGYNPCLYGGGVGGLVVVAADKVVQRLGKIVKFCHLQIHLPGQRVCCRQKALPHLPVKYGTYPLKQP